MPEVITGIHKKALVYVDFINTFSGGGREYDAVVPGLGKHDSIVGITPVGGLETDLIVYAYPKPTSSGILKVRTVNISGFNVDPVPKSYWVEWMSRFMPDDLSNLQLWLKPEDLVLNNNDPIATWADASGNAFNATQATAGKKPLFKTNILNGYPAVRFDGVDDYLTVGTALGKPGNYTVFAVISKVDVSVLAIAFGSIASSGATGTARGLLEVGISGSGSVANFFGDGTNFRVGSTAGAIANNTPALYTKQYTSGQTVEQLWKRGVSQTVTDILGGTASCVAGTAQEFALGRGGALDTYYWGGDIVELIIYNTSLASYQRQQVEAYLINKYAL